MRWSRRNIRAGVLAALVIPALAIVLTSQSQAQFPKPGGPRIPTMPNIPSGPKFPTMPNMPSGIGGGSFNPNRPNFPGGGITGIGGGINGGIGGSINGGIGGGIGGPRITKSWKCSGCGAHLGTGDHPPGTCPGCNARIVNGFGPANGGGIGGGGIGGGGIGGGMASLPGNIPPPANLPPPGGFIPPNQPPTVQPNNPPAQPNVQPGPEINAVADEGQVVEGPAVQQPVADNAEAGGTSLLAKVLIGMFAGLFGFALVAGGIFLALR